MSSHLLLSIFFGHLCCVDWLPNSFLCNFVRNRRVLAIWCHLSFLFPLPSLLPSPLLQSQRIENDRLPLFKFNSLFFRKFPKKMHSQFRNKSTKSSRQGSLQSPPPVFFPSPSFSQVQFTLCISVLAIPESDTTLSILHLFEPEGVLMTKLQVFFDVREVFRAM